MPSVVHHKDGVCLWGGQLDGDDINREMEGQKRGDVVEEVRKPQAGYMGEALFTSHTFILYLTHS